jgi:hypothetical protein
MHGKVRPAYPTASSHSADDSPPLLILLPLLLLLLSMAVLAVTSLAIDSTPQTCACRGCHTP